MCISLFHFHFFKELCEVLYQKAREFQGSLQCPSLTLDVGPKICHCSRLYLSVCHMRLIYLSLLGQLTSQICTSCFCIPWYFSVFSFFFYLMFLIVGMAISITTAIFWSLSTTTMTDWITRSCLSVWSLMPHRISEDLKPTLDTDTPKHYPSHVLPWSKPLWYLSGLHISC